MIFAFWNYEMGAQGVAARDVRVHRVSGVNVNSVDDVRDNAPYGDVVFVVLLGVLG